MIIDFNRYNGGGSGSGSTDLTNYWNSAVTEQHIESAASITYASAASYADQAVAGIDLSEYLTSADTADFVTSAYVETKVASAFTYINEVEQVTASGYTELHDGLMEVSGRPVFDSSAYYTSAQTESAITQAVSGKADAANVQSPGQNKWLPTWNEQGIITGTNARLYESTFSINDRLNKRLMNTNGSSMPSFYAPESAGTAGDILMSSGSGAPIWITPATINGSAITSGGNIEIQAGGGGISQADLASSGYLYCGFDNIQGYITNLNVRAVDYLTSEDGGKIVDYDHDTWQPVTEGGYGDAPYPYHIKSIWKSDYDYMVAADEQDANTLYIVLPDPE